MTWTSPAEVDAPSATMGVGEKLHASPVAGPGLNTIVAVVVVTSGDELSLNVTMHPAVAPVLEKVKVARPADVVVTDVVAVAPEAGVSAAGHPLPAVPLVT